jgi:hypothetical protein
VWIQIDDSILSDYGIIIDYFYETSLSWAYNPNNYPLPAEDVEQVLAHHKNLNMETFLGPFPSVAVFFRKTSLANSKVRMYHSIFYLPMECNKGGLGYQTSLVKYV